MGMKELKQSWHESYFAIFGKAWSYFEVTKSLFWEWNVRSDSLHVYTYMSRQFWCACSLFLFSHSIRPLNAFANGHDFSRFHALSRASSVYRLGVHQAVFSSANFSTAETFMSLQIHALFTITRYRSI